MTTTNLGTLGQSTQTAQQGVSNARGTDTVQSAVNSGLQGVMHTLKSVQAMLDKQIIIANSTHKLSVQYNGSLKTLAESANQQTKAVTTHTDAVKGETTARKENTRSSSQENQARQAAKVILDKETLQRKKQLESDVQKNRLDVIQHASLGAAIKHSRDVISERSKIEQQILKNEQEMLSARSKQEVKALDVERKQLQARLVDTNKLTEAVQETLRKTGGIASVSDAMDKFRKKLQDFSAGAAIGIAVRKVYDEAQYAKTTGNYANMGQFAEGQGNAVAMGIGSQAYNEIVANARAAQLTTSSFAEFNTHLEAGTDKLQTLTGSREEGARLAGELFKNAGLVGITMADMGSQMNVLGDTFGRLSKVTGKLPAEMAQLSMSIMTDNDHRAVMLGMQNSERADYVVKRTRDIEALKLQGFSLEQAQELQKIAMHARTQGLAEKVGKDAKASAQAYVMANMVGGTERTKIIGLQQEIAALEREGASTRISTKRRREIEDQTVALRTQQLQAGMQGSEKKSSTTAEFHTFATAMTEFKNYASISEKDIAGETGSTEAQKKAKAGEGNIGGKGSPLDIATTLAGYGTAIKDNTIALSILTGVMGAHSVISGLSVLKGTPIAGKLGGLMTSAKKATVAASEISGAGMLARGAAGGGYAFDAMKASKLVKGVSLLAPIAGAIEGYSNYDSSKHNLGESVGLGVGSATGSLAGGWGGAAAGAALGTMLLPGIGTIVGGALGGLGGGLGGDWLGGKAGKAIGSLADSSPAEKAKADAEAAIHPELAKTEQERAALTELQKQYYTAGIEYYKNSDPKTDQEARAKHAAVIHRLATNSNLDNAAFSAMPTSMGG